MAYISDYTPVCRVWFRSFTKIFSFKGGAAQDGEYKRLEYMSIPQDLSRKKVGLFLLSAKLKMDVSACGMLTIKSF